MTRNVYFCSLVLHNLGDIPRAMDGITPSITIGDSVLSLIDVPFTGESSTSADLALQNFLASPDSPSRPVKSSKTSLKTYNAKWERDPLLRTWIARHPTDPGKVVCCYCNSLVRAHKNDLLEHTRTVKHQRNYMPNVSPQEYKQFIFDLNELKKEMKNMTNKKICSHPQQANPNLRRNSNNANNSAVGIGTFSGSGAIGYDWNDSLIIQDQANDPLRSPLDDHDDVDGIMMDSPSDLVSVVLEEEPTAEPVSVSVQPGPSTVKRKRRSQPPSISKSNGRLHVHVSPNVNHSSFGVSPPSTQKNTLSSAQKFLKILNAIQSEPLSVNELLLLKQTIDTRINSLKTISQASQGLSPSPAPRNVTNFSKINLNSISKNNGITITSMPVPVSSPSKQSNFRKRKQEFSESLPKSVPVKMEMIDVTPDVSDYGIQLEGSDYEDEEQYEQFKD